MGDIHICSYLVDWLSKTSMQALYKRDNRVFSVSDCPRLGTDLCKDKAQPKCNMKRPYSTHLSYEKILEGLKDILDFSSTHILCKRL